MAMDIGSNESRSRMSNLRKHNECSSTFALSEGFLIQRLRSQFSKRRLPTPTIQSRYDTGQAREFVARSEFDESTKTRRDPPVLPSTSGVTQPRLRFYVRDLIQVLAIGTSFPLISDTIKICLPYMPAMALPRE